MLQILLANRFYFKSMIPAFQSNSPANLLFILLNQLGANEGMDDEAAKASSTASKFTLEKPFLS